MSKAREVLNWTLENKKLDVEIKKAKLESVRSAAQSEKTLAASRVATAEYLKYLYDSNKELSEKIKGNEKAHQSRWQENINLREDLETAKADLVIANTEISCLRNDRFIKFILSVREFFTSKAKPKQEVPRIQEKLEPFRYYFSKADLPQQSPEVKAMSADEFKKQYIDPIVLVDPAAL